ncbi:zinc-binding alcohol dehydrogenase [Tersicoccus sp. Bi-70]|uniref:zinc-dependent alcohol dehydrogenase n=1 Tax=Tersicoccus sp. Bi-70 TaxID=1897634 RepID=UPI00097887F1|nr:zinc-binding alcohol dehydrogenase [Tersicoccus sp. Bi-70]OMH34166.1 dehydrogenase [Tersicoccus sp. Bi-70]
MSAVTTAFWVTGCGRGELRQEPLREPGDGEVLVRTVHTGISRGTETTVFQDRVPPEVADQMRAPHQEGDFGGPVKYGYLNVGVVERGPAELAGRTVFSLAPHQDRLVLPAADVHVVPDDVPARRAVLAGTVETAVNGVWEAGPRLGDRVAVVGGGMVGGAVAALLAGFPLDRLQLVDPDPGRRTLAEAFDLDLVVPEDAAGDCDVVVHASGTEAGLATALDLAGADAELVEMSWFGTRSPRVPLGGAFHARRLQLRASQVGEVALSRRARRTRGQRLELALRLLADDRFDVFLTGSSPFADLPATMARITAADSTAMCHVIDYPATDTP